MQNTHRRSQRGDNNSTAALRVAAGSFCSLLLNSELMDASLAVKDSVCVCVSEGQDAFPLMSCHAMSKRGGQTQV